MRSGGSVRRAWRARSWVVAGGVVLAALLVACRQEGAEGDLTPGGIVVTVTTPAPQTATPTPRQTPTPTPTPSPTPLQVCTENPDPAPPSLLQVEEPRPEAKVKTPFHVRGWGSTIGFQDAGVAIALVDVDRNIVPPVMDVPPQPRTYRIPPTGLEITDFTRPFGADVLVKDLKGPTPFCLWVYLETDAEGNPKGVLQVPLIVSP